MVFLRKTLPSFFQEHEKLERFLNSTSSIFRKPFFGDDTDVTFI